MFLLDFDYVHFLEKEAHNFDRLVDYLPWTIFTGCPKKRTFRILKVCGLPPPVKQGHIPSNPVSQKGNSEGAFFGTPFSFK